MTDLTELRPAYSHDVMLRLIVGERTYPLAQMGPKRITFRDGVELPEATVGILEMSVAGRLRQWSVLLPYGATPFDLTVECHDVAS